MSKAQTNQNVIKIQFAVKKGDKDFERINKILEMYNPNQKAYSIKRGLEDFLRILKITDSKNIDEFLLKFIKETSD